MFPANEIVGGMFRIIATVEIDGAQIPLLIVHCNTLVPVAIKNNNEVGDVGVTINADPETTVQLPVPTVGKFAARTLEAEQIV